MSFNFYSLVNLECPEILYNLGIRPNFFFFFNIWLNYVWHYDLVGWTLLPFGFAYMYYCNITWWKKKYFKWTEWKMLKFISQFPYSVTAVQFEQQGPDCLTWLYRAIKSKNYLQLKLEIFSIIVLTDWYCCSNLSTSSWFSCMLFLICMYWYVILIPWWSHLDFQTKPLLHVMPGFAKLSTWTNQLNK